MTTVRQLQAYKETQITTTDPGTVLLLLYQGAIDALTGPPDSWPRAIWPTKANRSSRPTI